MARRGLVEGSRRFEKVRSKPGTVAGEPVSMTTVRACSEEASWTARSLGALSKTSAWESGSAEPRGAARGGVRWCGMA